MNQPKNPVGRPRKTGADIARYRTFRLTDDQYEAVKAFVRDLKNVPRSSKAGE